MVTASFVLACLAVLALSLFAEHRDRKHTDAVVFTVSLLLSLVICLVGDLLTKHYWPRDIRPMIAMAAFTDAALSAVYISRFVKTPARYKLILAFMASGMCAVHLLFIAGNEFSKAAIHGWWFTANVYFALSLLIVGSQGGGVVLDVVRRYLSRLHGGRGLMGHVKARGER